MWEGEEEKKRIRERAEDTKGQSQTSSTRTKRYNISRRTLRYVQCGSKQGYPHSDDYVGSLRWLLLKAH